MKLNRLQLRKLIKETVFLNEGDDHHKTEPKVTDKETAHKIAHHAGPKTNEPLKLKYFHPEGGHYSLELKNAKYVDGHVRFDANVFGEKGVDLGLEGHFEIPIGDVGKKDHGADSTGNVIQGTEYAKPHGEVSLEIAKKIPEFLGDAKLSLKGTAGTDFAGHDEFGWSIGIKGGFGGSKH